MPSFTSPLFYLLFALFLCKNVNAQDTIDPDHVVMAKVVTKVMNDLKAAKGILPFEPPQVKISSSTSVILGNTNIASGIIKLQDKAYLECRALGADSLNALAWILGHELGHYIHKHGEVNHSISQFNPNIRNSRDVQNLTTKIGNIKNAGKSAKELSVAYQKRVKKKTPPDTDSIVIELSNKYITALEDVPKLDSILSIANSKIDSLSSILEFRNFLEIIEDNTFRKTQTIINNLAHDTDLNSEITKAITDSTKNKTKKSQISRVHS